MLASEMIKYLQDRVKNDGDGVVHVPTNEFRYVDWVDENMVEELLADDIVIWPVRSNE